MLLMLGESRICILARRRTRRLLLAPGPGSQRASAARGIQRRHDGGSAGQEIEDAAAGPAGSGIGARGKASKNPARQAIDPSSSRVSRAADSGGARAGASEWPSEGLIDLGGVRASELGIGGLG
jgi:hypothetical protein